MIRNKSPSLLILLLLFSTIFVAILSERSYDEVLFTPGKCKELGYEEHFDVCAVMEFCSSDDSMSTSASSGIAPIINHAKYGWRLEVSTVCSWPGPILRLQRGLHHGLVVRGGAIEDVATNLHFHGLHIPSTGSGDDSQRSVRGSDNSLVYDINLPADKHHGGTYWYHSHLAGDAWEQVRGGAFGMIVVEENGHDIGTRDPHVLEFMNQHQNELILILDNTQDTDDYIANGIPMDQHYSGGEGEGEGEGREVFHLVQDQWYRMRILTVNVGSNRDQEIIRFSESCTVHALAHDGIFRFTVPQEEPKETFILTSSSRLDVAIRCNGEDDALIYVNGQGVARIEVDGTQSPSSVTPFESHYEEDDYYDDDNNGGGLNHTFLSWQSSRLEYTKDLRSKTINPSDYWSVDIDETNINGINSAQNIPLCDDFNHDFRYNSTQEWIITGADTHPIHLHVYPMQVVGQPGGCGNGHDVGEYYDTIVTAEVSLGSGSIRSLKRRSCVVRLHLVDVAGPALIHCHIFEHAERGSSGWINVVDDGAFSPQPLDEGVMSVPSCRGTCEEGEALTKCSDLHHDMGDVYPSSSGDY